MKYDCSADCALWYKVISWKSSCKLGQVQTALHVDTPLTIALIQSKNFILFASQVLQQLHLPPRLQAFSKRPAAGTSLWPECPVCSAITILSKPNHQGEEGSRPAPQNQAGKDEEKENVRPSLNNFFVSEEYKYLNSVFSLCKTWAVKSSRIFVAAVTEEVMHFRERLCHNNQP